MRRNIYTQDHEDFRTMIRDFIESEVVPGLRRVVRGGNRAP